MSYMVWFKEDSFYCGTVKELREMFKQDGEISLMQGYTCQTKTEAEQIVKILNKSNIVKRIR